MEASKLKLSIILLAICVPIALATLVFNMSEGRSSFGTTSKGVLIQPVLDISELGLTDQNGQAAYQTFEEITASVSPDDYKPRPWQLFYLGSSNCDAACQERLYFLRQLHIRLGAESKRVQRVYVLGAPAPAQVDAETTAYLQAEQQDMRVLNVDPAKLQQALARALSAGQDPLAEHYILVMDPVGNIMLYFTPANDAEQMLDDIDNLLDNSSLG
jgi:cytochrome oxidase Cu insertion factor (SCO1/SenC/PrrC family)